MSEPKASPALTSELVFARLERLRALLKRTDHLRGFRPKDDEPPRAKPIEPA